MEKKLYEDNIIYLADGLDISMPEVQTCVNKSLIQLEVALWN